MINIDAQRCTGCGLCASDCTRFAITIDNGTAVVDQPNCIDCGHCTAICPTGAATRAPADAVALPYDAADFTVPPKQLLNLMKFRRSVRHYQNRPLAPAELDQLLEAARYSPHGGNRDTLRFIVVQSQLEDLKTRAMKALADIVADVKDDHPYAIYRERWGSMYANYQNTGADRMFFGAPAALLTVGRAGVGGMASLDGGLASSRVEMMAAAMGLGTCHIGFFTIASGHDTSLRADVGMAPAESLIDVMIIGHPAVRYQRTVVRRPLDVTYL